MEERNYASKEPHIWRCSDTKLGKKNVNEKLGLSISYKKSVDAKAAVCSTEFKL